MRRLIVSLMSCLLILSCFPENLVIEPAISTEPVVITMPSAEPSSILPLVKPIIKEHLKIPPPKTIKVVERTPQSITIEWEFADTEKTHSYRLYLDGKLIADNIHFGNYTLKNLKSNTIYEVELETILNGSIHSNSSRISLKISTTSIGKESSGNYGSSGGNKNIKSKNISASPSPTPTPTPNPYRFKGKVGESG